MLCQPQELFIRRKNADLFDGVSYTRSFRFCAWSWPSCYPAFTLSYWVFTVLVALSFEVVTLHLCNKAFPSACRVIVFPFFFFLFLIMWLSYCTWLKIGHYLLQLLKNRLQHYLLKGPVFLWFWVLLVLKMFFQSHLLLSLHTCTCTIFIPVCVKGCRCYYRLFLFCRWYLPFSVQAGLQIFTYLCDFLFCFGIWIYFSEPLYLKLSVFFWRLVVFVFVTRVLALCRDGSKLMSDLPLFLFFFFIEE